MQAAVSFAQASRSTSSMPASRLAARRSSPPSPAPSRTLRAKEMVFLEGERSSYAYQVIDGAVRLQRITPDGRRQLVGFACPGDWIAIGAGERHSHTAEALVDSRLRPLSSVELDRRMREDRAFLDEMVRAAAEKLLQAEGQMILLGQRSALEKVAAFLLSFARRLGEDAEEIRLPMDRSDIADYLGLTIETVSRKFTQLKSTGVIALPSPSCVRIKDMDALETIAEGGEELS